MEACSPIIDRNIIEQIKQKYLEKNQIRELLLFLISINTGVKLVDLLKLKVCDIKNKDLLVVTESDTGKKKVFPLNSEIKELAKKYTKNRKSDEPLFISVFGKPVDRVQVFRNFKEICAELGIKNSYSVSSWRKTFAYHYYKKYKDLAYLMWLFNQPSVSVAFKFIGVGIEENMNLRFREGVCL